MTETPSPLIGNVYGRAGTSLNGKWRTIVDPYESGYYDVFGNPSRAGYFRNHRATDPGELVEYRFDTAELLDVPGDWNSQRRELFFYEGTIWYLHPAGRGRRWDSGRRRPGTAHSGPPQRPPGSATANRHW